MVMNSDAVSRARSSWVTALEHRFLPANDASAGSVRMEELDAELIHMKCIVAAACRRRNALLSHWCRLPPEILVIIFEQARACWRRPSGTRMDDGIVNYDLGWIDMTHVCAYWRDVALSTPKLWSVHESCLELPGSFVPVVLERSQGLPLSLIMRGNAELHLWRTFCTMDGVLSPWFSPATYPRLDTLILHDLSTREYELVILEHLNGAEMPSLRVLRIAVFFHDEEPKDALLLPHDFCKTSTVSDLALRGCLPSSWSSPWFNAGLTHLRLDCSNNLPEFLPSAEELSSLLATLKSLEVLDLDDVFPYDISEDMAVGYPQMALPPTLVSLRAASSSASVLHYQCLLFLTHLDFSQDIHLVVTMNDPYHEIADSLHNGSISPFAAFDLAIRNLFKGQSPPKELILGERAFLVHKSELPRRDWTTYTTRLPFVDVPGVTSLAVPTYNVQTAAEAEILPRRTFLSLPLEELHAVSFGRCAADSVLSEHRLDTLSASARKIHRLGVDIRHCAGLFQALTRWREGDESSSVIFNVFPHLSVIHIHNDPLLGVKKQETCEAELACLVDLVRERRIGYSSIKELVIDSSLSGWRIWQDLRAEMEITFASFYVPSYMQPRFVLEY